MVSTECVEHSSRISSCVLESAHDGIVIINARHRIVSANQAFTSITGFQISEVLGKRPTLMLSALQNETFYAAMWQSIEAMGRWSGEIWNRRNDGEVYAVRLKITAVKGANGKNAHYIGVFSDITDLKDAQRRLEHMESFDVLTGLPNRTQFLDCIAPAFAHPSCQYMTMAVCFMDLDNFKVINERFGHDVGDKMLIKVADRLKNAVSEGDTIARTGGDEFIMLLTNLGGIEGVKSALEHILGAISQPYEINGEKIVISTSIGATVFPADSADPETLVRHADQSMYRAKQEGRNRFHIFDPARDQQIHDGHQLAKQIHKALRHGEMKLHYQPKVNMRTGTVVGMEALLRWNHPVKGMIGPEEFLRLRDHEYLHAEISEWVIRTAMSQISQWNILENLQMPVSVNIEACYLMKADFTERIALLLSEYPEVDPKYMELEILESAAMHDLKQVSRTIQECRNLGVTFALDDFGTGYSPLTYLKHLPVNNLKIDQTFVRDMLNNKGDLAVARGVIGMADVFELDVIAEGVETPEHGIMLMQLGCDVAQGYGISRPMPAEQVVNWVRQYQPYHLWKSSIHVHKDVTQRQGAAA